VTPLDQLEEETKKEKMTPPIRIATHQQHAAFPINYDKYLDAMPSHLAQQTINHSSSDNNENIKLVTKIRKIKQNLDASQLVSSSVNQWNPPLTSSHNNFNEHPSVVNQNGANITNYNSNYLTNSYLSSKYLMLNSSKQNFDFKLSSNNVTSLDNISLEQFHNEPLVRNDGGGGRPVAATSDLKSKSTKFIPIINNYEFNSHSLKPKKIGEHVVNGGGGEKKSTIIKGDHSNANTNLLMKAVGQVTVAAAATPSLTTFKNAVYTDNVSRQSSIRSLISSTNAANNNNVAPTSLNNQQQMSNFVKIKQTRSRMSIETGESGTGTFQNNNEMNLLNDWDVQHNPGQKNRVMNNAVAAQHGVSSNNSMASSGSRPKARMGFQQTNEQHITNDAIRSSAPQSDFYSNNFSSKSYSNISSSSGGAAIVQNGQMKFESVKLIKPPQSLYTKHSEASESSSGNAANETRKQYNSFANLNAHKNERTNILNTFGKSNKLDNGSYSATNETESIVSDNFMNNLKFEENGAVRNGGSGGGGSKQQQQQNGYHDIKANGKL
jgi:hypothetical protein